MDETPFLSQKLAKSETKQQLNNHRSSSVRGSASNSSKHPHPDPPPVGQVAFRLLCHVHTAGGVIGNSGSVIKQLETLTGSKIRFEESLPNCHERVINIVGDAAVEKKMSVGGGQEDEMADLSKAQAGLLRVFERVLEVEGNTRNFENEDTERRSNEITVCRLLAQTGKIRALMGKGGKVVDGIRKRSGAKVRVLKEQLPACAGPEEELVQITGGILAVKTALVAVSRRLQDPTQGEGPPGHLSSHGVSHNVHVDLSSKGSPSSVSFPGNALEHHSVGHSLSADFEKTLNLDEDSSLRKVMFRILCSNGMAGGVIGKGASIVKSLENETGASIKFTAPVSGSKDRVATISALESPDPLYSPAQIATIRVFARCMEVYLDHRSKSSLGSQESVSARILVASSQVGCLLEEGGRVASDLSIASGAELQLMGTHLLPKCAEVDDNLVQITGDYENVKSALFQLTGRLRENFFSRRASKGVDCRQRSSLAIPSSSVDVRETELSRLPYVDQLDHLGFVQKSRSTRLPGLQSKQANRGGSIQKPVDSSQVFTVISNGSKHESDVGNEVPTQTVNVVVPGEVFGFVYGENGSNLARLREISGATVIIKDPCPGESNGKVIISGTPDRIQIAQSLLHAFVSL